MGCHKTKEDAKKQLAALYINEPEATKEKSTMNDMTTAFFEITKSDKNDDGTLTVYGKATDDSLDIDQQICDDAWLKKAMPDWFTSGGNIREMHTSKASGVATDYEVKKDGHYISALVVDPTSVMKVEKKVLKGFSIGIKNPRLIRDSKAVNGRIVDGQIVEVSLVDRPANPNCQLVLAKSATGEEGIWKVEELIEKTTELDSNALESVENSAEKETDMAKSAQEIIARAKTIAGDTVKFDQALYNTARTALAQLIVVEAQEMVEGSDERNSLNALISAVSNLEWWYEGEEREGEVTGAEAEDIELAAKKEAMCKECGKVEKECKCDKFVPADAEKSADADLVDAELPIEAAAPVADEVVETPAEETTEEVVEEVKEVSSDENLDEKIEAAVEKAVSRIAEKFNLEVAELKAASEAAVNKAAGLETELVAAKSLAVGGGPKKTIKPVDHASNDLLVKAATFKAKADASTDPDLTKGYKILAEKYFAEAAVLNKSN